MNEVIRQLHERKSVRAYLDKPIEEAEKKAILQAALDKYLSEKPGNIDYIHGEDVVMSLCEDRSNFGIIFDAMEKTDLYKSVIIDGALPRKTFSMGDACDKRFYTEARKIK